MAGNTGPRVVLRRQPSLRRVAAAGALGLVAGGLLLAGTLSVLGAFSTPVPPTAVERLAAAPVENGGSSLAIADDALPAVARVVATGPDGQRLASAVVVRNDGRILTTSDAVDGASGIVVTLGDGSEFDATLLGRDRRHDIGVLGIDASDLPVVAARDTRLDQVVAFGDTVVIVNAAPIADTERGPLLSQGVISSPSTTLSHEMASYAGAPTAVSASRSGPMHGMVRITLPPRTPQPGPGAVVLDRSGALVGVVTSRGAGVEPPPEGGGVPVVVWAVPFDHIRRVYLEVLDSGRYVPADLGVTMEATPAGDTTAGTPGTTVEPTGGVMVRGGLPGDGDNLDDGDVITHIGGTPVFDVNDARTEVRRYTPGEAVDVTVVRNGSTSQVRTVVVSDNSVP